MLIVLFIMFLIMIVIGMIFTNYGDENYMSDGSEWLGLIGIGGAILGATAEVFVVAGMISAGVNISQLQVADSKIAMYEEENNKIQEQISSIVENYKDYEKNTYTESLKNIDIKNTDVVVLAQLYPDLKADGMVTKQIDIYTENNNKIKELKEQKLDYQVAKWWLYFGKIDK